MEFDIGNILYIVITLVAVLIGVLGKKKKPGTPATGEGGGEARPGFMENLERFLTMGQENPPVVDLREYEEDLPAEEGFTTELEPESRRERKKAPSIMDDYDRIMQGNREGKSDLYQTTGDGMIEPLEVIELDVEVGTGFHDMVKKFDAKTAIVYSAIINRLDY
jgi:hypothetical protein